MNRTINKSLVYGICTAIYLTLIVPLVLSPTLYFPFVTGKAYIFRLMVEIALALYLVLILRDRSYLPKKNLLTWSLLGFTVVLGLATIFAESPYRAFWSNFERMEGYVMILHLFAFFIVTTTVFKGKKAWMYLLNTSLAVSVVVGVEGFMDLGKGIERIAGTLGNSSYLGVYALLHMFIAGFLLAGLLKGKRFAQAMWGSIAYIVVILFNGAVLYQTGTRGSVAGVVAGVVLIALLMAILEKGMKRKIGVGLLVAMVVVVSFFGTFKNASFIKNHDLLYRFSSLITFDVQSVLENQGSARVLLWGTALRGVQERPIVGWGQDNFGYVFAKYYNPAMYDQEQWFDRTHDVFLDWLISGGILALLGYLSLFYALLYMLWKSEGGTTEKSIFTGMILAYFVHNIFVFDNLSSYIIFFILLAYVSERYNSQRHEHHGESKPLVANTATQALIAIVIGVACVSCVYFVIYKPYMAGKHLIYSLQPNLLSAVDKSKLSDEQAAEYRLAEIKTALGYNTFGNTEIRERLTDVVSSAFSTLAPNSATVPQVLKDMDDLVSSEFKKQFESTPNDPRPYIFYAMYLQKIGANNQALTYSQKAVDLSPMKQSFQFQKGTIQIAAGKFDDAIATLKMAYEIEPKNNEGKVLYALGLIYAGKFDEAKAFLGDDVAASADGRVLQAFLAKGRYQEIVDIVKTKIVAEPTNGQLHMSLAGVYLKMHRSADAIAEIQEAVKLSPQFATIANYYIKEIKAGRDPSAEPTPTQEQLQAAQ